MSFISIPNPLRSGAHRVRSNNKPRLGWIPKLQATVFFRSKPGMSFGAEAHTYYPNCATPVIESHIMERESDCFPVTAPERISFRTVFPNERIRG